MPGTAVLKGENAPYTIAIADVPVVGGVARSGEGVPYRIDGRPFSVSNGLKPPGAADLSVTWMV